MSFFNIKAKIVPTINGVRANAEADCLTQMLAEVTPSRVVNSRALDMLRSEARRLIGGKNFRLEVTVERHENGEAKPIGKAKI